MITNQSPSPLSPDFELMDQAAANYAPGTGPPPAKKLKEGNPAAPKTDIDPEQLGDVLNAAGVDLREEESLLSNSLTNEPGGIAGARLLHAPRDPNDMLLNADALRRSIARKCYERGLRVGIDDGQSATGLSQDPLGLLSAACEEWLGTLLSEAAAYSRHRRLNRSIQSAGISGDSSSSSEVTRALRRIAQKEKDAEQNRANIKLQLGIGEDSKKGQNSTEKESEELMQKTVNDTARMMTAAIGRKKKFSWMSDGSGGGSSTSRLPSTRNKNNDAQKNREVREDNGIVLRDLLAVLEGKHMGVKRVLMKGYARLRN